MDAATRERQIERAWAQHEPERARAPPSARRAVAAFKARLAPDAERIKGALRGSALPLIDDWAKKGSPGRERKLRRIKAALGWAAVDDTGGALRVLWLEPRGQMVLIPGSQPWDHPSFAQDSVLVVGAVASRQNGRIRWSGFPVLEVPDHALARMFQRSPGVAAAAAIYEASIGFLRADRRAVEAARLRGAGLCLAAGPGLALCQPIAAPDLEGKMRVVARASTWIAAEMAARRISARSRRRSSLRIASSRRLSAAEVESRNVARRLRHRRRWRRCVPSAASGKATGDSPPCPRPNVPTMFR